MRKTAKLDIIAVLFVYVIVLAGFCSASSAGDTVIEGNIVGDIFQLTVPQSLVWTAESGQTSSEEMDLEVTSNNYPWSVRVKSDSPDGKAREFDGINYVANPITLKSPLHVSYGLNDLSLNDSYQNIISGNEAVSGIAYKIRFAQQTSASDLGFSSGHVYRILVTFTGGIRF